jgi:3-oxoacyl-(acyl-carrier-protein) synthase III
MTTAPSRLGILGTGSYVPDRIVGNEEIAARAGVTVEWIERKTRIGARRHAGPHEATSTLAAHAARAALEAADLPADWIDHVIVSTSTPDFPQPPTAHLVQDAVGACNAAALDVNVVCSGFVYALALARGLLASKPRGHALVIAADLYSRSLDFTDRRTAVLMADGAGAAVVGPVAEGGFIDFHLAAKGSHSELIRIEAGGSRRPATAETVADGGHHVKMEGRAVRDFVLEQVPPALADFVTGAGYRLDDVDHYVPHQPNGNLLSELVEKAGLTGARTHRTLDRYGNMGSASIAVTLDEAVRSGEVRDGELVLLSGFGGGMAIGSGLLHWTGGRR